MIPDLHYRILELSYKHRLSHIGSCLGAVDIIDSIYSQRGDEDPFILSVGHAGLALYAVLEKRQSKNAEDLLRRHGVHPRKSPEDGIYCSTGSLGQGLSVSVGRALADRNRSVWCLISDGESAEGVVYEALSFARQQALWNLKVYCHWNGFAAYRESHPAVKSVLTNLFPIQITNDRPDDLDIPFLTGQDAHYYVMKEADWTWVNANR